MTRCLVLRLDAPLQSWGSDAVRTRRDTESRPTLSGVVGLLASALGRDRTDPVDDLAGLWFGVRADRRGQTVVDYQTAGADGGVLTHDKGIPVLSKDLVLLNKVYLSGASFLVVLAGDDDLVEACAAALRAPARPLFLGRKSCPVTPDLLVGVVDGEPGAVLRDQPLPDDHDALIEVTEPASATETGAVLVRDMPVSFATRAYAPRFVRSSVLAP